MGSIAVQGMQRSKGGIGWYPDRRWWAEKALEVAGSRLRQKALLGFIATGHVGIGYLPAKSVDKTRHKERQHLVIFKTSRNGFPSVGPIHTVCRQFILPVSVSRYAATSWDIKVCWIQCIVVDLLYYKKHKHYIGNEV